MKVIDKDYLIKQFKGFLDNKITPYFVKKEAGKILSTNDLTNDLKENYDNAYTNMHTHDNKTILDGITANDITKWNNSETNVQVDWNVTDTTSDAYIKNKPNIPTKISELTNDSYIVSDSNYVHTDKNFSADLDKKLASLPADAQANVIEGITLNGETIQPNNKIIAITVDIPTKLSAFTNDNNYIIDTNYVHTDNNLTNTLKSNYDSAYASIHTHDNKSILDGITNDDIANWNSKEINVQSDWSVADISSDAYIKNKPEIPTVTNDLTNELKTKYDTTYTNMHTHSNKDILDNITSTNITNWNKAETNVQSDWAQTDTTADDYIKNKPTIPTMPTKTSELTNDSNYVVDSSYVHTDNNFTTTLKDKLTNLSEGTSSSTVDAVIPRYTKIDDIVYELGAGYNYGNVYEAYNKSVGITMPNVYSGTESEGTNKQVKEIYDNNWKHYVKITSSDSTTYTSVKNALNTAITLSSATSYSSLTTTVAIKTISVRPYDNNLTNYVGVTVPLKVVIKYGDTEIYNNSYDFIMTSNGQVSNYLNIDVSSYGIIPSSMTDNLTINVYFESNSQRPDYISYEYYDGDVFQDNITSYTNWGNVELTDTVIKKIKSYGFKTVRLPVTWSIHVTRDGKIHETWFETVKKAVDLILDNDLYCIMNMHHDCGENQWLKADASNSDTLISVYDSLWNQIIDEFSGYADKKFILEGFNEILDSGNHWLSTQVSSDNLAFVDTLNQHFVDLVRVKNYKGWLCCNSYAASSYDTLVTPKDTLNKTMLQYHVYRDYFTDDVWKERLDTFSNKYCNFVILLGEFGWRADAATTTERVSWITSGIKHIRQLNNVVPCIWDDGGNNSDTYVPANYGLINKRTGACFSDYESLVNALTTTVNNNITTLTTSNENVQADWSQTDTTADDYIKNKPTVPTKTSELTNDNNYVTDESYVHTDNNFTSVLKTKIEDADTLSSENSEDIETFKSLLLDKDYSAITTLSWVNGSYIRANATTQTASDSKYAEYVPIKGKTYRIITGAMYETVGCVLLDSNNSVISYYPQTKDSSNGVYTIDVTIPDNCEKMLIGDYLNKFSLFAIYDYTDKLKSQKIEKVDLGDTLSHNFSDVYDTLMETDVTESGYISVRGTLVDASGTATHKIYDISDISGSLYIKGQAFYEAVVYAFCTADDTLISYYPTESSTALFEGVVPIPSGATKLKTNTFVSCTVKKYTKSDINVDMIPQYGNCLYQKKWCVCGDSFTEGDFTGYTDSDGNTGTKSDAYDSDYGHYKTYPYWIRKRNDMDIQWLAKAGSTFTNLDGADRPFSNSETTNHNYTLIDTDCDYVTFMFGLNETGLTTDQIGTKTDTTNTTLWGAYNIILENVITNNPTVKIGIIISDAWMSNTYRTALIEIAKYWGIPYLDLKNGDNVPLMIDNRIDSTSSKAVQLRNAAFQVTSTNTHPNVVAHQYRSTVIENWLRSL